MGTPGPGDDFAQRGGFLPKGRKEGCPSLASQLHAQPVPLCHLRADGQVLPPPSGQTTANPGSQPVSASVLGTSLPPGWSVQVAQYLPGGRVTTGANRQIQGQHKLWSPFLWLPGLRRNKEPNQINSQSPALGLSSRVRTGELAQDQTHALHGSLASPSRPRKSSS